VLARLDSLDGVIGADVDRAGDLLRLRLEAGALEPAITLLRQLGYEVDLASESIATSGRWYDASSVGELLFIEAGAIAGRVVPAFARTWTLSGPELAELHDLVVSELHRCFTDRGLVAGATTGAFRRDCVAVVIAATPRIVSEEGARALGALLDADMRQDHRTAPNLG